MNGRKRKEMRERKRKGSETNGKEEKRRIRG